MSTKRKTRSMKNTQSVATTTRQKLSNMSKRQTNSDHKEIQQGQNSSGTRDITLTSHYSDVFDKLHEFQKVGKFCDIKLISKTGCVMAHRLVLVAVSPFFYQQLEQTEERGDSLQSVDLKHIPLKMLKDIVSFIYSGQIKIRLKDVIQFAKHCQSIGLKTLCDKLVCDYNFQPEETVNGSKCKKLKLNSKTNSDHLMDINSDFDLSRQKSNSNLKRKKKSELSVAIESITSQSPPSNHFTSEISDTNLMTHDFDSPSPNINRVNNINETDGELSSTDEDFRQDGNKMVVFEDVSPVEHDDRGPGATDDQNHAGDTSIQSKLGSKLPDEFTDNKPNQDILSKSVKNELDAVSLTSKTRKAPNLSCKKCSEVFPTQTQKIAHKKMCKGPRPRRRCILCKISFATVDEYTHHRNTDPACIQIRKEKHTKRLQRKAQLRARYACRACPRKFRRVADLVDHEFTAHDLPYDKEKWPDQSCEWCSYRTMNPWRLHHHVTYDCSKGNQYICDVCGNNYKNGKTLKCHKVYHHITYDCSKGNQYICDVCGNNYKNGKTLKCHKEMMHTDVIPMLACDQCGKSLKGQKGLEYHIQIMHKGENPHKRHMCHMCSMKYSSSSDLTFHLHRIHNQPLPEGFIVYTCPECGYMINHKRAYEKHMLLHQDKRDFPCDKCDKAFKTRGSLQTHLKSHIGKKIPCPYENCKYEALKKCHLQTHVENQHTKKGVKNEKCHVCSYSTFFKGNLIKHLRTVHQLEVVTRYSVQMKAKYKHLKTGDIVGEAAPGDNERKPSVKCDRNNTDCKDGIHKQQDLHVSNIPEFPGQSPSTRPHAEFTDRTRPLDLQYTTSPYTSVISQTPHTSSFQKIYANYYTPGTVSHITNTPDQSMASGIVGHPHISTNVHSGYSREGIQYESDSGKSPAGVAYHGLFQEQGVIEEGAKMLTYIQI